MGLVLDETDAAMGPTQTVVAADPALVVSLFNLPETFPTSATLQVVLYYFMVFTVTSRFKFKLQLLRLPSHVQLRLERE